MELVPLDLFAVERGGSVSGKAVGLGRARGPGPGRGARPDTDLAISAQNFLLTLRFSAREPRHAGGGLKGANLTATSGE